MIDLKFFYNFLKKPKEIASILPSSKSLIKNMIKPVDFENSEYIVELGAGNGCVTKQILENMSINNKLVTFEINQKFIKELKKLENIVDDGRFRIVNDSAEKLEEYLIEHRIDKVDYFISGLPLIAMKKEIRDSILKQILKYLSDDGRYIQMQYSLTSLKEFKEMFNGVKLNFTFMNLPPAFVYICSKS